MLRVPETDGRFATPGIRTAALIGLFGLGVAMRLAGLDRAVWVDEAWVIESVRQPALRDMFHYAGWAQTTPPGVLLVLRALNSASAGAPETYRLAPLLCSLLALAIMLWLAGRVLAFPAALLAGLYAAASPYIVWYSVEIKQFPFDYCASALLLACGFRFVLAPSRRRLHMWTAAGCVAACFSYTALFWLPALLLVPLCFVHAARRDPFPVQDRFVAGGPPGAREVAAAFAAAAAVSLVVYFVFGAPNRLDVLREYWSQGFPESTAYSAAYYLRHSIGQLLRAVVFESPIPATVIVFSLLGGGGVWALARRGEPRTGARLAVVALLAAPPFGLSVANLAGLYPVGHFRLLCFLVPPLLLALAAGVEAVLSALPAGSNPRHARDRRTLAAYAVVLTAAVFVGHSAGADRQRMKPWIPKMNARDITRYLHATDANAVPVYVDAISRPMFDVYRSAFPVTASKVVYGVHNTPCCIPGVAWTARDFSRAEIAAEFDAIRTALSPGPFHALLHVPSRDALQSLAVQTSVIEQFGCRVPWRAVDTELTLFRIVCATGAADPASALMGFTGQVGYSSGLPATRTEQPRNPAP